MQAPDAAFAAPSPTSSLTPALNCGCVSQWHCLPANTTLVMVGDPALRYQYLDLVYTLHFRRPVDLRARCHPLLRTRCARFSHHAKMTWHDLQPAERVCNC
eukprot:UN14628